MVNVNDVNGEFTVLKMHQIAGRIFESVITRLNRSTGPMEYDVQHQISSCQSGLSLRTLFPDGIDHIGTHHIATGESSFRLQPSIPINALLKCTCWMHWRVKGQPYFRFFSGTRHRAK